MNACSQPTRSAIAKVRAVTCLFNGRTDSVLHLATEQVVAECDIMVIATITYYDTPIKPRMGIDNDFESY